MEWLDKISAKDGYNIQSSADVAEEIVYPSDLKLPNFTPQELVGLTFTHDIGDGKTYKAKAVTSSKYGQGSRRPQTSTFLIEIGDAELDELISYNELSNIFEKQEEDELNPLDKVWTYKAIRDH